MRKGNAKRLCAALLAVVMILLLVACGGSNTGTTTTTTATDKTAVATAAPKEIVSLQMFEIQANTMAGPITGWLGDWLEKKVGVKIELLPVGDQGKQKMQAFLAAGELPDLVGFDEFKQVSDAIAGKLLINLDEHLDKLPNVVANAPMALKYARDKVSNGTNLAYAALTGVGPAEEFQDATGPFMRWDLYKKLGYPEIKTPEDYIPLMKQMVDLEPKNKDGQKTYGITLWKDWDKNFLNAGRELGRTMGVDTVGGTELTEYDYNSNKTTSLLDANSYYVRTLKMYNAAYKAGVLDPDSITQTFDSARTKYDAGRVMFAWPGWLGAAFTNADNKAKGIGFRFVPYTGEKGFVQTTNPIGTNWSIGIGAKTKDVDACLATIDALYNIDNVQELRNGSPEGITWKYGTDNIPAVTDQGWDIYDNDKELPTGGKTWHEFTNLNGLTGGFINPKSNLPLNFNSWPSTKTRAISPLYQDFADKMGYVNSVDYIKAKGMLTSYQAWKDALVPVPDDIQNIANQIGAILTPGSWSMIYAKDQAAFDKTLKSMQDKAATIGIDKVIAYDEKAIKDAQDLMANYTK